jgi:hypothetical protein
MPKTFITERDIEDLAHQGTLALAVDDNTVLTDLAYEKAGRLGVKLLQANSQPPASPIRPYLSQQIDRPVSSGQAADVLNTPVIQGGSELKRRVIEAATARLGGQVDAAMLATIVERVLADLGVK